MARNGRVRVVGSADGDVTLGTERSPAPGETVLGGPVPTGLGGRGAEQAVLAARVGADSRFPATVAARGAGYACPDFAALLAGGHAAAAPGTGNRS